MLASEVVDVGKIGCRNIEYYEHSKQHKECFSIKTGSDAMCQVSYRVRDNSNQFSIVRIGF